MPLNMSNNPFPPQELTETITPAPRNPSVPSPMPEAGAADPDFEARRQRWKQYLSSPEVRTGLMQFGVSLLTPGVGFSQALGQAVAAGGRTQTLNRQRQTQVQEQQMDERRLANEERRTRAYEQAVQRQGTGTSGDMTEREKFGLNQQIDERTAFEKVIRDRASAEFEAAQEAYNEALIFGTAGEPPSYNTFYNRVSTEEVLRRRGSLDLVARMSPADQQQFWRFAEQMGPELAIQKLQEFWQLQQSTPPTQAAPEEQTNG